MATRRSWLERQQVVVAAAITAIGAVIVGGLALLGGLITDDPPVPVPSVSPAPPPSVSITSWRERQVGGEREYVFAGTVTGLPGGWEVRVVGQPADTATTGATRAERWRVSPAATLEVNGRWSVRWTESESLDDTRWFAVAVSPVDCPHACGARPPVSVDELRRHGPAAPDVRASATPPARD
ncbi:MAG: hypothetical protein ACRDTM_17955 [Micromonosporaceae bacterium]